MEDFSCHVIDSWRIRLGHTALHNTSFNNETDRMRLLENLVCSGDEKTLEQCTYNQIDEQQCDNFEISGVQCSTFSKLTSFFECIMLSLH